MKLKHVDIDIIDIFEIHVYLFHKKNRWDFLVLKDYKFLIRCIMEMEMQENSLVTIFLFKPNILQLSFIAIDIDCILSVNALRNEKYVKEYVSITER